MRTKHTPGPWQYVQKQTWPFDLSIETESAFICGRNMPTYSTADNTLEDILTRSPETNGQAMADFKLIAAAPDLLKACQAALDWCYTDKNKSAGSISYLAEVIAPKLNEAIKKATE